MPRREQHPAGGARHAAEAADPDCESKNGYFTNFEGTRYRLADGPDGSPKGPKHLAALKRFGKIMHVQAADTAGRANTVRVVVDLYGQHLDRSGQGRTPEILLQTCTSAVAEFGARRSPNSGRSTSRTGWRRWRSPGTLRSARA